MEREQLRTTCLGVLTIITVFVALQLTKEVTAPIFAALLLGIVLTPLSDFWDRLKLPVALAAFLSVLLSLLMILLLLVMLEPYVTTAINRAPVIWNELRETIEQIRATLRGLEEMSKDVATAIDSDGDGAPAEDEESVKLPSAMDALFYAPHFAAQIMVFTGTLYFFLLARNAIYDWFDATFDSFGKVELRHAAHQVSRYVLTITAINFSMGCIVAVAMSVLGMPTPILWGVLAFVLNYIVYLGPIALIVGLLVAGIVVFEGASSFLPAVVYFFINATEAQFVTPALVGKTLSVNPLLVFLSLVFWLWLWGPIGGIIALPLLIWSLAVFKGLNT